MSHHSPEYLRNRPIIRRHATNCWRCGRELDPTAQRGQPGFVTAGHLIAVEDGGDDSLANLAPECEPCNYADGAARTNKKRRGNTTTVWHNTNW